jgi:hypothetical protein
MTNDKWYVVACGHSDTAWLAYGVEGDTCEQCGTTDCHVPPADADPDEM